MGKWIMGASLALAVWLTGAGQAGAQEEGPTGEREAFLAGAWTGAGETPAGLLGMGIHLELREGGWKAVFTIPAERVELEAADVRIRGDSVLVSLVPGRTLTAVQDGDSLSGELDVDGRRLPVVFGREGSVIAERLEREMRPPERTGAPSLRRTDTGPGEARVDADALGRLVEAADRAGSDALVVTRHGERVGAWHAGGERRRIELMSVTKSVLSLAVGRLLRMGTIDSIDEPVHTYFPQWREGPRADIKIRHLLNHTSGLATPETSEIYASDDFVQFALDSELVSEPGTEIAYNNNAANLLAGVLSRAAGQRLDRFLRTHFFEPMGIVDVGWSLDDAGNPHGMSGLQLHAEDLATLGQLVLQGGEWDGEQLIDSAWLERSLRPGSEHSDEVGLLWWLIREDGDTVGYRADGYLGQYLIIYPHLGLVGVRLVASSPEYNPQTDGFREFETLLRELAPRH